MYTNKSKIKQSYYYCKKKGAGNYYKNCRGVKIKFLYKVFLCDNSCCFQKCESCLKTETKKPIEEGITSIVLGEGRLFDFIENTLLNEDIRRNSPVVFVLCPKDAFDEIGFPSKVPPDSAICIYLEEPAV